MENILITKDGVIKVTDLGFATFTEEKITKLGKLSTTQCGTLGYMAPEILDSKVTKYDPKKSDMFSLGVILFELLYGKLPYETPMKDPNEPFTSEHKMKHLMDMKKKKLKFPKDIQVSDKAKKLISKLLNVDPKKRPTAQDVYKDPWLAGISD